MKTVGVRELRQQASAVLRDVERGEVVEVTAHGRAVARLVPVDRGTLRDRLSAAGRLVLSSGDPLGLGDPLPRARGAMSPSVRLRRARGAER